MNTKTGVLVVGLAVAVLIGGHVPNTTVVGTREVLAAPSLGDLKSVEELKTLFNRDAGKVRLVLLLSPT